MTKRDRRSLWALLTASTILLWAILTAPAARDEIQSRDAGLERPREELAEETEPARVTTVQLSRVPPPPNDAEQPESPPPVNSVGEPAAGPGGADSGTFPEIVAGFAASIGFEAYVRGLSRVGARFFIVRKKVELAAEVDATDLSLMAAERPLEGLSPRSREISDPKLRPVLARAAREFGEGDYRVIVLFPESLEWRLVSELNGLARAVPAEADSFVAEYRLGRGGISIHVLQIRTRAGDTFPVSLSIPLEHGS